MAEVYIPKKGERVEVRIELTVQDSVNPQYVGGIHEWMQLWLGASWDSGAHNERFALEVPTSPTFHAKHDIKVEIVPVEEGYRD